MSQIALPLAPGGAGSPARIVVGNANRAALEAMAAAATWPFRTAILFGPPRSGKSLLARWFDVQVPTGGDAFTVNVGQYWPNDKKAPFANRHAASLRAIYDLQDMERSQFVYQTGQSGLVFSGRYRDMAQEWAEVRYRDLRMDPATIRHTLTLAP